jgi:TonB family protein
MSVVSNAPVSSASQGKYVGMLHELLRAHSVGFGKAANFGQLIPKLVHDDKLRVEFSMLVQWIQRQEEGNLTLNQMLTIIWIAMTGSTVDALRNASSAPLMIFLSGLGGWQETEADREKIVTTTPRWNPSEARAQIATSTSVRRKDEERQAREAFDREAAATRGRRLMVVALWLLPVLPLLILCVALYRDHVAPTSALPGGDVTDAAPAAHDIPTFRRRGRSSRASPRRQPSVEDRAERAAPGKSEQENAPWPVSGLAVLGENGQPLTFEQTGGGSSVVTEPAKIHTPKPEPLPAITEGGARMPGVMPEAIVTLSYPTVVAREAPRLVAREAPSTAPDRGRTSIAGTESRMPAVTPVVVASSTAPPVATVARTESRSTPVKGKSSAKTFDLLRPRVAVSAGLLSADIVRFQMPSYPKSAQKQRLGGDVLVRILISEKGKVARAVALSGPPSLRQSVEKAVSHWRYLPYMENGKPVAVQTWVTFHFELRES